jgi:hypothetical protein
MPHLKAVLLALVVATGVACNNDNAKPFDDVFVKDLRPGQCFIGSPRAPENAEGEKRRMLVVSALSCNASHEKEVFAVFEHPAKVGAPYPEQEEVAKAAQDGCAERFEGYVGRAFGDTDLQVAVIAPGPVPWTEDDDRTIVCTLSGDKPLKGSQKADGD